MSFSTVADESAIDASKQPDNMVGAVCVIRSGDNLIMLSEVITNKLSLPGGYIDKGDTPQEAAAREALEETGIAVEVEHLIQYRGRAAIFACKASSPILMSSFKDSRGYPIVASWFSKHFATEVERVYLINPLAIEVDEYRYAEDAALLPQWLAQTPDSEVKVYDRFDSEIGLLHEYELGLIDKFQHYISTWPPSLQWIFCVLMYGISVLGEPWFVFIIAVVIAGYGRTPFFLEMAFLMLVALFGASLLKHGLMMPRPYFFIPALQKVNAYGFGFPSGHILMASLLLGVWGYLLQLKFKTIWSKIMIALLVLSLIVGQGVARVWFGVHFISDVILSFMLSIVVVAMFIVWRTYEFTAFQQQLTNRWFWLGLSVMVGTMAGISLVPVQAYLFAILLGIFLGIDYAVHINQQTSKLSVSRKLIASACVLVGAFGIYGMTTSIASLQTVSLIVLGIKGVGYLLLGAWLASGSAWVRYQLGRWRV